MLERGGSEAESAFSSWTRELAGAPYEAAPAVRRCKRCGRRLTRSAGLYGPVCARKQADAIAALRDSGNLAAGKAADLLEREALQPTGVPGTYLVPSSDGKRAYQTDVHGCSCAAGQHALLCHHRVAVTIARSFYLRQWRIRSAGVKVPERAVDQPTAS